MRTMMLPADDEPRVIYRLRFGREVYIGSTMGSVSRRVADHRCNPANARLHELLCAGREPVADILGYAMSRTGAVRREAEEIDAARQRGDTVLNKFTPGREGAELSRMRADARGRLPGTAWCSLCRIYISATNFNSDISRSSGLASRCRDCSRLMQRLMLRERRRGRPTGPAYAEAIRIIREWQGGGRVGPHPGEVMQ